MLSTKFNHTITTGVGHLAVGFFGAIPLHIIFVNSRIKMWVTKSR